MVNSDEKNKSTLKVDEEDILKMSEKIKQNKEEQKAFKENLHKLLQGDKKVASSPLVVGQTPNLLVLGGADNSLDLTIGKKIIDKAIREEKRDYNGKLLNPQGQGLGESELLVAINNLKNPAILLKGNKENSLIAITFVNDKKR